MLFQQELFNKLILLTFFSKLQTYTILYLLQIAKLQGRHRRAATPGLPAQGRYHKITPAGPQPQSHLRRAAPQQDRPRRTALAGPHRRVLSQGPPQNNP